MKIFSLDPPKDFRAYGHRGFIGTTWAIFWRTVLPLYLIFHLSPLYLLLACFVISAVMKAFGIELLNAPILDALKELRLPIYKTGRTTATSSKSAPSWQPESTTPKPYPTIPPVPKQYSSTKTGKITGLEPRFMSYLPMPQSSNMFGTPGIGLQGSGFTQTNVSAGTQGEISLAKFLAYYDGESLDEDNKSEIFEKAQVFFSLHAPDLHDPINKLSDADIDCVIYVNNTLLLVDAKMFRSGDLTYKKHPTEDAIICIDNVTGTQIGNPIHMSHNMSNVTKSMQVRFPEVSSITPVVVVMPTDRGAGDIDPNLYYPGGVPIMTPTQLFAMINRHLNSAGMNQPTVAYKLESMLKK